MASTTIHSLVYKVVADSQQFTKGITATRTELSAAKKIMMETMSPADRLGASIKALDTLLQKEAITVKQHAAALNQLQKEYRETEVAAAGAGKAVSSGGLLGRLGGVSGIAGSLGLGTLGAAGAVAGIAASANAADEAIRQEAKLEAVLKATGGAAGFTASQLTDYAGSLSKLTGVEDDLIVSAEGVLATFKNVQGDAFIKTIGLAADLSAVLEQDLQSSVVMLGKAMNDPIKGITALGRAGIQFSAEQRELIKTMTELGDIAGAQGIIMKEVASQVGGAAQAMKSPIQSLTNDIGNLSEAIGKLFQLQQGGVGRDLLEGLGAGVRVVSGALEDYASGRINLLELGLRTSSIGMPDRIAREIAAGRVGEKAPEAGKTPGASAENFEVDEAEKMTTRNVLEQVDAKSRLAQIERERARVIKEHRDLEMNAAKDRQREADRAEQAAQRIADRIKESTLSPGQKLAREMFEVEQALMSGRITRGEAGIAARNLREGFEGQFRREAPSRTAGAALEKNSAEAFSAIMKAADRGKKDELPKIAQDHLQVAQQTLETLRQQAANPVQVVENNF